MVNWLIDVHYEDLFEAIKEFWEKDIFDIGITIFDVYATVEKILRDGELVWWFVHVSR